MTSRVERSVEALCTILAADQEGNGFWPDRTLIEIEGPITRDEIARRITSLWGLQRTGARIAEAIASAVPVAVPSTTV
jgi:hypothetical protein